MTPLTKVLCRVFFRSVAASEDRDRRLRETEVRVHHASRMFGNAMGQLSETSAKLRQAKDEMMNREMVDVIRQLSTSTTLEDR